MSMELEIKAMGVNETWNIFKIESEQNSEMYNMCRFGINVKFDINNYLKGRLNIKGKSGKVFIRGRVFDLEVFETELENRERLMKRWLEDNLVIPKVYAPRGE